MRPISATRTRAASSRCAQSQTNKQQLECNFKQQLRIKRNNGHVGTKYVIWKTLGKNQECFNFRFLLIIIVWRCYGKIFIRSFRVVSVVCFSNRRPETSRNSFYALLTNSKVTCTKTSFLVHEKNCNKKWINNRRFKVEIFALIHPWSLKLLFAKNTFLWFLRENREKEFLSRQFRLNRVAAEIVRYFTLRFATAAFFSLLSLGWHIITLCNFTLD